MARASRHGRVSRRNPESLKALSPCKVPSPSHCTHLPPIFWEYCCKMPTIEQIEDYLESMEELFFASLSAATPDLPNVRQAIQRLWEDMLRHGPQALPSLPDLHIPGLGAFEVPPPPPPPPPPKSLFEKSTDWIGNHKWTTAAIGLSLIGVGLLAGYSTLQYQRHVRSRRVVKTSGSTERRQIVGECRCP